MAQNPSGIEAGSDEQADNLAAQVLEVLRNSPGDAAYEPVAEYLVTRVEDILGLVAGQTNVSGELIEAVLERAFVPLTVVNGLDSVGELFQKELMWELGDSRGRELAAALSDTLGVSDGGYPTPFDNWLAHEFFSRHIVRLDGEPEVWHLSSETGVVQVLAYGRKIDRTRLSRINTEVVRRAINAYERALKSAVERDDVDAMDRYDAVLKELHQFEVSIGVLQVGSSEDSRIVYPWRRPDQQPKGWHPVWAEGMRANIAPLQRLGLLAAPVLSDSELGSFQRVG